MLQPVAWKFGLNETPADYNCPIYLYQDDAGIIWLKWIDEEAQRGANERQDDSDRFPICCPWTEGDAPGVYESTFNLEHFLRPDLCNVRPLPNYYGPQTDDTAESWATWHAWLETYKCEYGVADNLNQVLAYFADEVADPVRRYVLEMSEVRKSEQPEHGGWRWHKWGDYIGTRTFQHEYLYDENDIEMVWCFHIHEIEVNDES